MNHMKEKITEVAQVLLGINCPVGLYDMIGARIKLCADRLAELAELTEKAEEEKSQEEMTGE